MDRPTAQAILAQIAFPGYAFEVDGDFAHATYLQASFLAPCTVTPDQPVAQKTRKWVLSSHMTRSELVQTAFKCVLTSVEHEARELFRYRGTAVFGPHFDVEQLHELCKRGALEVRP